MNVLAAVGRRAVSLGFAWVACVSLAVSTQAMAVGPDAVVLPAMEGAAPHAATTATTATTAVERPSVKPPVVMSELAAAALLDKPQAKGAAATPDDREIPFPSGWMLGLLAVLALVLFDRIRLSMKLAKLNEDALRSSGLSAPLIRH